MDNRLLVHGKKLSEIRRERYMTQEEFAQKLQMSPANVRRLEQSDLSGMQAKNFRRLAEVLNLAPDELRDRIGAISQPIVPKKFETSPPRIEAKRIHVGLPAAIRPAARRAVEDVEHYHGVSAARIEEREGVDRGSVPVPSGPKRRFAVTVDGDCMEPKYHNGEVVIFSVDAAEKEGIIDGKNYFLQLSDGQNTFKRVFLDLENRDLLELRCWNPKYAPRAIERSQVKLLARAIYRLMADE